ncbi:DNA recombination/repair protein RecA, partial [Clostridioides difficile]|nr:DNA recombination/repair protein RecA [Clostridioides difficile]
LLDIAADVDIVKKSGSWYSYNDTKLGQGRENVKKFLEDNLDLTTEIDEKVRAFYNLNEEHEESGTSVSKEIVEE